MGGGAIIQEKIEGEEFDVSMVARETDLVQVFYQ